MRSYFTFVFAVLFFPLCILGCIQRPKAFQAGPSPDIGRIIGSLERDKNDLISFGGVGRLKTVRGSRLKSVRIVWIGCQPQHLRVEVLGPWGQPTLTFIIDKSRFYLRSRQDNRFFKGDATVGNLSRFLSISVRAEDLFGILSGQPPILPFHHAKIQASKGNAGWLLCLYKKWGRLTEKIWLKEDAKVVKRVEVFDAWGDMQYRVEFSEFHHVESFFLPHRISFFDKKGPLWSLTVEEFLTKVSIPDGAFTLEPG